MIWYDLLGLRNKYAKLALKRIFSYLRIICHFHIRNFFKILCFIYSTILPMPWFYYLCSFPPRYCTLSKSSRIGRPISFLWNWWNLLDLRIFLLRFQRRLLLVFYILIRHNWGALVKWWYILEFFINIFKCELLD